MLSNHRVEDNKNMFNLSNFLGKVIAPSSVPAGLLFYFGWARSHALYRYFGIDQSMLDLSTQDYVFRSFNVTFVPIAGFLFLGLGVIWGNFIIRRILVRKLAEKNSRIPRVIVVIFFVIGILILLAGLLGASLPIDPFSQIAWSVGFGFIGYGLYLYLYLRQNRADITDESFKVLDFSAGPIRVSMIIIIALSIFGLFWTAALYAEDVGKWDAMKIITEIKSKPDVIVFSRNPLIINAPGVVTIRVSEEQSAYQYRYEGLKLLIRSKDKYFLLPVGWSESHPITIILSDTDEIRIEVAPGENGDR